ncbi:hypothetical protein [Pseudoxanthomonas mexicana]
MAERTEERLGVKVRDTGVGLPEGQVGRGLGTQIVRTLIQGELRAARSTGTRSSVRVPR